jgi:hypothetical protein
MPNEGTVFATHLGESERSGISGGRGVTYTSADLQLETVKPNAGQRTISHPAQDDSR